MKRLYCIVSAFDPEEHEFVVAESREAALEYVKNPSDKSQIAFVVSETLVKMIERFMCASQDIGTESVPDMMDHFPCIADALQAFGADNHFGIPQE